MESSELPLRRHSIRTNIESQAQNALTGVVDTAMKYDKNGIDLHFMNQEDKDLRDCTSSQAVARQFQDIRLDGSLELALFREIGPEDEQ